MFEVSRVEVIHHASGGHSTSKYSGPLGPARAYQYYGNAKVTFHLQDDGQTLKIFVDDQD